MMILRSLFLGAALAASPSIVLADGAIGSSAHGSDHVGFEARAIKSLSEADLDELRRGAGWGFALAAELNGIPGPAHLLELHGEIPLSAAQAAAIERMFDDMRTEAVAAGVRLIEAEEAIEMAFRAGELDNDRLRLLISEAEAARTDLRFIHLSRHLSTPPLLSVGQIARYNLLRGNQTEACGSLPGAHDTATWPRHNTCD